jgi:hypothetical protein
LILFYGFGFRVFGEFRFMQSATRAQSDNKIVDVVRPDDGSCRASPLVWCDLTASVPLSGCPSGNMSSVSPRSPLAEAPNHGRPKSHDLSIAAPVLIFSVFEFSKSV